MYVAYPVNSANSFQGLTLFVAHSMGGLVVKEVSRLKRPSLMAGID